MTTQFNRLFEHLAYLYGEEEAGLAYQDVRERLERFKHEYPDLAAKRPVGKITEKDVILITYGDMVRSEGEKPLATLRKFLKEYLTDVVSTIHILPFYPYSSDDGFSVIDYREVNSDLGEWGDIAKLSQDFRLMFDAVINHCSSQSAMFQGFLKGEPEFENYFTVVDPDTDLSKVFRPRATPVVTPFQTKDGEKLVWTTFSADQVDLNFKNPAVLLEIIDILLFYVSQGADFIRFDAVTYVWKEKGSNCINLPQTHRFVQLMRTVMDYIAPHVVIITETNVPHEENIAYFGDGTNEAQMVYNFALPLLTLHSFLSKDVGVLTQWADTLRLPSDQTAFFNFLACHDGIGMLPVKEILDEAEIARIMKHVKKKGGYVSFKTNEDGTQSPYELNINYLDALDDDEGKKRSDSLVARRFLASQAIMLSLRGVPGIYFHSLFGSMNWQAGVEETGRYRTINREKLDYKLLKSELSNPESLRSLIYQGFAKLLKARQETQAFHPFGEQKVLEIHPSVFSVLRISPDQSSQALCLHNVSGQDIQLSIKLEFGNIEQRDFWSDILTGRFLKVEENRVLVQLSAYEILWLEV